MKDPKQSPPAGVLTFKALVLSVALLSTVDQLEAKDAVHPSAKHITLPLASAHVLPTSYGIESWIENGDTIMFKLDRPRKVAVVPNYDEAWQVFVDLAEDHEPIRYWADGHDQFVNRPNFRGHNALQELSERYKNGMA